MTEEKKIYYKIGEVSRRVGVADHTIRYWEREFSFLKPKRDKRGQRLYEGKDLTRLTQLKELLYRQGYRISAAKRLIRNQPVSETKKESGSLKEIVAGLKRVDRLLSQISKN